MPGRKVGFSDPIFAGAKVVDVTTTLTNNNGGSVNVTLEDERIIAGMRLIALEITNPEAVGDNINFHPTYGELQITCSDIEGSTAITASFLKIDDDPTAISSSEYDILNNKIELIKNVDVNFPITIETTDWTLDSTNGYYAYTWTNSAVTTECSIEIQFLESEYDADVDCVYHEKVTGGVKFSVDYVPSVDIPVNIRITNTRPKAIVSDITAEMVSQESIAGASNVDEALNILNSKTPVLLCSEPGTNSWTNVTLSQSISNFKMLNILSIDQYGAAQSSGMVPTEKFKTLTTSSKYMAVQTYGGQQNIAVLYVDDTTVTYVTASTYMEIYGIP